MQNISNLSTFKSRQNESGFLSPRKAYYILLKKRTKELLDLCHFLYEDGSPSTPLPMHSVGGHLWGQRKTLPKLRSSYLLTTKYRPGALPRPSHALHHLSQLPEGFYSDSAAKEPGTQRG